jgi:hypothetical protein
MSPLAKVCHRHGRIVVQGDRCPECPPWQQPWRDQRARRPRDPEYLRIMNSHKWKKARAAARRRDGGCLRRDEGGCAGPVAVHHVVRIRDGGDPFDLVNLRTLCRRHHGDEERR